MNACPACQAEVMARARFCSSCGTRLADAEGEPSPPPTSRRFGTADAMKAERRQLTVMFCDIADSTRLSEVLDPEDLMAVVRRYQSMGAQVIERLGGNIAQYLGDGLLVYFGYPTAYENAPERAARAGLEILDALAALNTKLQSSFGISLKLRLGIHTGLVVIGEVGGGAKREQLAVGDTANIAARLESLASPNSCLVSEATRQLIGDVFETESLGRQELKGIAMPVEVHRLVRLSTARHRLEDAGTHSRTPFFGRSKELEFLQERWRAAGASQGTAVLLTAEAGVGKSRMIPAFRTLLKGQPRRVHKAYCSPFFTNSALHPLMDMLRVEAKIGRDDSPSVALGKLRDWLADQSPMPPDALPVLAGLLELPADAGYEELALSAAARKHRLTEVLLANLLPPEGGPPVLLILEDVHWVDPSTLDLIGELIARLPEHRLMVLMTARPVFVSPWTDHSAVHELRLRPLGQSDTTALVLAMTEGQRLPTSVLEQLVERTDGIPLFVEELTRMLIDAGPLENAMAWSIPTTLRDSLMARLDRIDDVARRVAQLGSMIGRTFDVALLQRIYSGTESELQRGLDELVRTQLIHRKDSADSDTFIFRHALIQDVAYESLLKKVRQQYHGRIADALEQGFGHVIEVEPELLAQHLELAGPSRSEAAARHWLTAGQKAQASSSGQEAVNHLRRGLALLPSLPETPGRVQLELSLLSTLGTSLSALKGFAADEVEQAYARAHVLCDQLGQTPERFWVLWGLWAFYLVQGTHAKGVRFAELMLELAVEQHAEELELEAHFSLGLSFFYLGDDLDRACEHLEWVVKRYDAPHHHRQALLTGQDVGVTSHSVSALVHFQRGEIDLAVQRHHKALALSKHLNHAFSRAYALGCAAWFQLYMRNYEVAKAYAQEAVTLSGEQSFGWWLVWGTILGGSAAAGLDEAEAPDQIEQGITQWRHTGSGFTVPYFLGLLCDARRTTQEVEAALPSIDEALVLAERSRERFFAAELHRLRGELLLSIARDESTQMQAEQSFGEAIEIARTQGARLFELRARLALARCLQQRGESERAGQIVTAAIAPLLDQRACSDRLEAQAFLNSL